jgi:ubiquinone/menaquinone biosynthesis C-methylase UbiE
MWISEAMNINYANIAENYDRYRHYSDKEIEKIIDFAGIRAGMFVLDLGCGTGNISKQLKRLMKLDIAGVDKSLSMLRIAAGKSLDVIRADVDKFCLPFRDNTFDIIVAAYVLHQIRNISAVFSECYRVLNNGRLVLLTSSHRQIETEHPIFKHFFPSAVEIDKARFPDLPVIENCLKKTGFTDIRYDEMHIESILLDNDYLEKVKGRYVSTYHLIPQDEFDRGVTKLEEFIKNSPHIESIDWRGTLIQAEKCD